MYIILTLIILLILYVVYAYNSLVRMRNRVTELRTQALASVNVQERSANENMLSSALRQLFAVAENYPDLKASQTFIELQKSLENIENQIQLARRYYNSTARDLNIAVQSFSSSIIANMFGFKPAQFFEIEDAKEREAGSSGGGGGW
jgi:LemA protein